MEIVKKNLQKIVIFTREKSLYIAWACFRNVQCVSFDFNLYVSLIKLSYSVYTSIFRFAL